MNKEYDITIRTTFTVRAGSKEEARKKALNKQGIPAEKAEVVIEDKEYIVAIPSPNAVRNMDNSIKQTKLYQHLLGKTIKSNVDRMKELRQKGAQYLCLLSSYSTEDAEDLKIHGSELNSLLLEDLLMEFLDKGFTRYYHPTQRGVFVTWLKEHEILRSNW